MPSAREMRTRIRSVKNISQVTHALEAVSASKVRKAIKAVMETRPYAAKAWQVLTHIAAQPGREKLHPLLSRRPEVRNVLALVISGDRGLAGAYNANIIRFALQRLEQGETPVLYVAVGRKGRDMLLRRRKRVVAEFSGLPTPPSFLDVSAIGQLAVNDFLQGEADEVWIVYTKFVTMIKQEPVMRKLLPLEVETYEHVTAFEHRHLPAAYTYEPGEREILDQIVPRFTALQIYQAILEAQASEHAARMVAMQNATENAIELADALTLEYNKLRQKNITFEMIDLISGTEALTAQRTD